MGSIGVNISGGRGSAPGRFSPEVQTRFNMTKANSRAKTILARRHKAELEKIKKAEFAKLQKEYGLPLDTKAANWNKKPKDEN